MLTRLPTARLLGAPPLPPHPGRCIWAYPLVGAAVGGLAGAAFWAGHALGLPAAIDAGWTLAASVLLTGGLHEDGLADTADGFGGGTTAANKLRIMHDSRIGSYGAMALMISFGIRAAAITSLRQPDAVLAALVAAGALGRGAILGLLFLIRPARADGLGASLHPIAPVRGATGLAIAVACVMPLGRSYGLWAVAASTGATLIFAIIAGRQVGGYTGDVLGAAEQIAECATLTVAASFAGW